MMKSIEIAPSILTDPNLSQIVDRANRYLEWVVGETSLNAAAAVSLSWELERDDGRAHLKLQVRDSSGCSSSTTFPADDPDLERTLPGRMIRTWGDLLQDRSHRQLVEWFTQGPSRLDGEEVLDEISDAIFDYAERKGEQPHVLKLPTRYAVALMKLGYSFWGEQFKKSRESGVREIDNQTLFGVHVKLVTGVDAEFAVE